MSGVVLGPKDPSTTEYFKFDYTKDTRFEVGETIVSASINISVFRGKDPEPAQLLTGPVIISGLTVSQLVTGGVLGTTYDIQCLATTSSGQVLDSCGMFTVEEC